MGQHPNVILVLALKPNDLSSLSKILDVVIEHKDDEENEMIIGDSHYNYDIMKDDYLEGYQISGSEGDLILHQHVTYGYGDIIEWDRLETIKKELQEWATGMCKEFNCSHRIYITANFW